MEDNYFNEFYDYQDYSDYPQDSNFNYENYQDQSEFECNHIDLDKKYPAEIYQIKSQKNIKQKFKDNNKQYCTKCGDQAHPTSKCKLNTGFNENRNISINMISTCSSKKPTLINKKIKTKAHKCIQVSNKNKLFKTSKATQTTFDRYSHQLIELEEFDLDQLFLNTNECISNELIKLNLCKPIKQISNFNKYEFNVLDECENSFNSI